MTPLKKIGWQSNPRDVEILLWFVSLWLFSGCLVAGEVRVAKDDATGWDVYTLEQDETTVRVVPSAGANAFSVVHQGTEFFRVPETLDQLPGVGYGNPILYPMPNRVRGASFTFEGRTYKFPQNGRGNFIHGLVNREKFEVDSYQADGEHAELTCSLSFAPGSGPYEWFPLAHHFRIKIEVREGRVRWTYEVDNRRGDRGVPFGVGFHPYLIYQESRGETFLTVPARHLMDATENLPNGKLLPLDGHPLDARQPRSLKGFDADDVFLGMTPERPAKIEFRDAGRSIMFVASKEFTHLVVWTPDRPFFGIENQTCSTDAHNLASQGHGEVAHLQVCPPGGSMTGSVEYHFE